MSSSAPLRDPGATKSDAPAYHDPESAQPRAGGAPLAADLLRQVQQSADVAQRETQAFFHHLSAVDARVLRAQLGTAYLLNCVLIAGSAVMVFFHEMLALRGVLVGGVTSLVLVVSLVMIAQEVGLKTLNVGPLVEKYCLLLATPPGRAALVVVLGMLVGSINWVGALAFWAGLLDAACLVYAWQAHPWFRESEQSPLLFFAAEPPTTAGPSPREVAD